MGKKIKISYFPSTATSNTVLSKNGIALDKYCVSATTEEDLYSTYTLDAKFVMDKKILDYLTEESILKVQMDYGKEIFRISKVEVSTSDITIVARQIVIADSLNVWLDDVRPTELSGQSTLNYMISKAKDKTDIVVI